jgi:hypothetical protein
MLILRPEIIFPFSIILTDVLDNESYFASRVAATMPACQMPTGKSPDDAFPVSSDDESDYDDLDDDQFDTLFPRLSELCRRGADNVEIGSVAAPGMHPNLPFL